jgi:WD40 repeat protein
MAVSTDIGSQHYLLSPRFESTPKKSGSLNRGAMNQCLCLPFFFALVPGAAPAQNAVQGSRMLAAAATATPSESQTAIEFKYQVVETITVQVNACYTTWSPDGQKLAVAREDNVVQIWDTNSWSLLRALESAYVGPFPTFAWSPDSRRLAIIRMTDRAILILDVASGTVVRTLNEQQQGYTQSLSWSPDGRNLASSNQAEAFIKIWDVQTGRISRSQATDSNLTSHVTWSPDGEQIAYVGDQEMVEIWSIGTGSIVKRIMGGDPTQLGWSPDGQLFAAAAWNPPRYNAGVGRIWVLSGKNYEPLWQTPFVGLCAIAWSPDSKLLATAPEDGTIKILDAKNGQLLGTLTGQTRWSKSAAPSWSRDGRLASSSGDGKVMIWSPTGKPPK